MHAEVGEGQAGDLVDLLVVVHDQDLPRRGPGQPLGLVHELQHVKLGALLELCDLYDRNNLTTVSVPWRADPRPMEGALHGLYAHLAVADLWRRRRGAEAERTFDRYRAWVASAAGTLSGTAALTRAGERFVAGVRATVDGWP